MLLNLTKKILSSKRIGTALLPLITDLKDLISCHNVTVFFLDIHTAYIAAKDGCYVHQYLLDGKWIQRVGATDETTGDPSFKKIEEL